MSDYSLGGLPQPYTIVEVTQETPRVRRYVFDRALPAEPGQFVMAWLPGVDEKPFSVMDDQPLTLAVACVGPFTEALHALGSGDRVWMRGPFGHGFRLTGRRPLLVAGGYGAAPLYALARRARQQRAEVTVVVGARTAGDLLLMERFAALGCQVRLCTDDGSAGECLLADAAAERALDSLACDALYACGPAPMLTAIAALARRRRLPAQVSREAYMRCGIGVCGSCACDDQLICRDGPVFDVTQD